MKELQIDYLSTDYTFNSLTNQWTLNYKSALDGGVVISQTAVFPTILQTMVSGGTMTQTQVNTLVLGWLKLLIAKQNGR